MEYLAAFAALGAALSWAIASLFAADASRAVGGLAFNRTRLCMVTVMLILMTSLWGDWSSLSWSDATLLIVSGLVGIALGDTALFTCMQRLGPRRSSLIFALNAPMTLILSLALLSETLTLISGTGIFLAITGVYLAIIYGKRRSQLHVWEETEPPLWLGVGIGLLAALGQALGLIIIKPVMEAGTDPMAAATVRAGISAVAMLFTLWLPFQMFRAKARLTFRLGFGMAMSGLLGMAVGMSLLLYSIEHGDAGLMAILSATSPVMILPLLWWRTRESPAPMAWVGAVIATAGVVLTFI